MKKEEASSTAFTVAQGTLHCARRPDLAGLVPKDVKEALMTILSASPEGRKRLKQLDSAIFNTLAPLAEKLLMPGITIHYVLRKRFIEDKVVEAVNSGVRQVVSLGAGFDTLAFRLSSIYPDVRFLETDHPATSKLKASALLSQDNHRKNLAFLPIDFTCQTLEEVVGNSGLFERELETLFISEGVLMYLTDSQVRGMLCAMKNLSANRPKFIFTFVSPKALEKHNSNLLLRIYLSFKSEPLLWKVEREELKVFLEENDYRLLSTHSPVEFGKAYLPEGFAGQLHEGELIALSA